jgi:hypothetical protein
MSVQLNMSVVGEKLGRNEVLEGHQWVRQWARVILKEPMTVLKKDSLRLMVLNWEMLMEEQ